MTQPWFVARAETNNERRAALVAEKFYRIEAFLPLIMQETRRGQERPVLMFPGYLFLRPASMGQISKMRHETFLISYLLTSGWDEVEPVGEFVVQEIKSRAVGGIVPLSAKVSAFHVGQQVRVARGRHADLFGQVWDIDDALGRVGVLLTLFKRRVLVDLDESLVVPVEGVRAA